ncbi:MAG TPA: tetratricopeptide repeat protein [Granulicella sp.]
MKRFGWGVSGSLAGALLAATTMMQPASLLAQAAAAAGPTASIHGHVQNPLASPVTNGVVKLTTDRSAQPQSRKYDYTFPTDASGNYKGDGIKPNTYIVIVFQGDNSLDFNDNVPIKAGDDKQVDFDMSRQEYLDKMTPEEKKTLEEYKAKNAEVMKANAQIANLNTLLTQARSDNKAGNYDSAITAMKQATTSKPDEPILWLTLGDAQLGAADKAAKAAGKPTTDASVAPQYTEAADSYKKAIELATAAKKPSPDTIAAANNQLGTVYGKMGDATNAGTAYDAAAKALPANAAMYYYNNAATLYNAGKMDDAAAAADKAIAADPKKADAYYIKGQSLIPKAAVDPKTQKITAPPGCVEAYQQYLEIAPDGGHAQEVKDILTGIGAQVQSSFKAAKPAKK